MTARTLLLAGTAAIAMTLAACDNVRVPTDDQTKAEATDTTDATSVEADLSQNPLLQDWDTPYGVPPFAEINDEHYMPAVQKALADLRADIAAIADNAEAPTFENTIVALDKACLLYTSPSPRDS